jgi:hypothetical protein
MKEFEKFDLSKGRSEVSHLSKYNKSMPFELAVGLDIIQNMKGGII